MNERAPTDAAWRRLHERATEPYRKAGNFAWHFARGKLGRDPVFRGLIERGLIGESCDRVVDIGCGQGLFASLLSAMSAMQAQPGGWPGSWPATPKAARYTGIELMPKDVARAEASVGHLRPAPRFVCADMCTAELPPSDLVVILDVLHYVDLESQEGVLLRVRDALRLRRPTVVACRRCGPVVAVSRSASGSIAMVTWIRRWASRGAAYGGPHADRLMALLERLGFSVQSIPMSEGTPFANVLIVADLKEVE